MGPQDGVDIGVLTAGIIINEWGRRDVSFTFMGQGDSFDKFVRMGMS